MFKNTYTLAAILFGGLAAFALIFSLSTPFTANAIFSTAPPRIISSGDVTTAEILNFTILGEDISLAASTTMFRLQVSDLSATSTTATSTFAGGLSVANNFFVLQGGRVGIGTTSPTAPLNVVGTPAGTVGGFASGILHITQDSSTEFSNSVITGHSGFSVNTQLWYLGSRSSSDNNIIFNNRQNASLSLSTNNTERLTIDATGLVGIGSTTPSETLSVAGTLAVTGATTFNNVAWTWPSADGTSGQSFQTDGAGTISLASVTGTYEAFANTVGSTTVHTIDVTDMALGGTGTRTNLDGLGSALITGATGNDNIFLQVTDALWDDVFGFLFDKDTSLKATFSIQTETNTDFQMCLGQCGSCAAGQTCAEFHFDGTNLEVNTADATTMTTNTITGITMTDPNTYEIIFDGQDGVTYNINGTTVATHTTTTPTGQVSGGAEVIWFRIKTLTSATRSMFMVSDVIFQRQF